MNFFLHTFLNLFKNEEFNLNDISGIAFRDFNDKQIILTNGEFIEKEINNPGSCREKLLSGNEIKRAIA